MEDTADFDRLCRTVYRAARAGAVDCTDSFDLAASVLKFRPADPDATELASQSLDCAPANRLHRAELTLVLLAKADFAPGFADEPGWLVRLQEAMHLVNRDMAATGLPHGCRLRVRENAYAETWDGHTGSGQGVFPSSGADPVSALVAVADDAQDAVMHALWSAWPECPAHRRGVHARRHDGAAVWWCTGEGGHGVARIGDWPRP
ncbi:hypothetical protein AB0C07_09245 [Actinoplanes missouriensis]|uniref:hypothetical protein n=1 Tax=Actinoplanes missouriensis TaxID=1866 RepID=UPI0033CC2130